MASQAQVNYARGLMNKNGVVGIHIDTDTPTKAASWLIDHLKDGYEPGEDEWEGIIRKYSDMDQPAAQVAPKKEGGGYDAGVFDATLAKIKSPTVKAFLSAMIKELPEYFYHVAASSTGKYHPEFALGEGGLVRHTLAAEQVADDILEDLAFRARLPSGGADMVRAAIAIHDGWKHGLEAQAGKYTIFGHPLVPRKVYESKVKGTLGFNEDQEAAVEQILSAIDSHMGPWNTSKYEETKLPVPETPLQLAVHLCDYMASRKYLTLKTE